MYDEVCDPDDVKRSVISVAEAALTHFSDLDELFHGTEKGRTLIRRNASEMDRSGHVAATRPRTAGWTHRQGRGPMRLVAAASVHQAQAEMVASMSVDAAVATDMMVLIIALLVVAIVVIAICCMARTW